MDRLQIKEQLKLNEIYRPLKFNEIVGQEKPKKILRNSIIKNNIQNAYMFEGQTGGGKTTTARIFLRALNCLSPIDCEPCGECEACRACEKNLELGDIIEIDGGENRGIDKIRELKDSLKYAPKYKYRGVIIDEGHMLTKEGFTALLKVLEEPPPRTIFILVSNESDKIMKAVKDRCVRLVFSKVSPSLIKNRLMHVCLENNISVDEDVLMAISVICDGSLREALTILQEVSMLSFNGSITLEDLKGVVSIEGEYIKSLMFDILNKNVVKVMECIDLNESSISATDFDYFISRFRRYLYVDSIDSNSLKLISKISNSFVEYKNKLIYNVSTRVLMEIACIECINIISDSDSSVKWLVDNFYVQEKDTLTLEFDKFKEHNNNEDYKESNDKEIKGDIKCNSFDSVIKNKSELFMGLMSLKYRDFEYKFRDSILEVDDKNILTFIVATQSKKTDLVSFLKREYSQGLKPICEISAFVVKVR